MSKPANIVPINRPILYSAFVLSLLMVAWFLYTGQIWEDFLITLRQSQNAAEGRGLVFTPGERIHGFTSPINVLLPAAILRLVPSLAPDQVLSLYNIVAVASAAFGWGFLIRHLVNAEALSDHWSPLLLTLAVGLNVKLVSFSMNGQEAAFTVLFLSISMVALWRDQADAWKLMGIGWAGLMWSRPDSCILVAALGAAGALGSSQPRKAIAAQIAKAAALCTALYGPWFAFATWYYGSPIPHTVTAKALYTASVHGTPWFWLKSYLWRTWEVLPRAFTPTYAEAGGWPAWLHPAARFFGIVSCLYWLIPGRDRIGRTASLVCFVWIAYQGYVDTTGRAFPWYFPAAGLLGAIILWQISRRVALGRPLLAGACFIPFIALLAFGFANSLEPTRLRQVGIEDGVRRELGLWLKEHVRPTEHVFLEPIGYIGYYSGCRLDDYPGLVSPRVVSALRRRPGGWDTLIADLGSEWLVLRPGEVQHLKGISSILDRYTAVYSIGTSAEFDRLRMQYPSFELNSDRSFIVFRHN